jgi:hypothetical protein
VYFNKINGKTWLIHRNFTGIPLQPCVTVSADGYKFNKFIVGELENWDHLVHMPQELRPALELANSNELSILPVDNENNLQVYSVCLRQETDGNRFEISWFKSEDSYPSRIAIRKNDVKLADFNVCKSNDFSEFPECIRTTLNLVNHQEIMVLGESKI